MSETKFNQAIILFREECEKWCSGLLARCNNDYCQAAEKLCQVMSYVFFTLPERMKNAAIDLNASRIEQIIISARKVSKFRYSTSIPYNKNEVSNEWVLTKNLHGKQSELTIEFCTENYIHICSWTDCWDLFAYS